MMKKLFFTIYIFSGLFCVYVQAQQLRTIPTPATDRRKVNCEDLEYRLHLTRTDIEMIGRMRHRSGHKDALLRELQDHELRLQNEIRVLGCFE